MFYTPAGTYMFISTLTCTTVPVYFLGDGAWATIIEFSGTGDCFRIYDGSTYGSRKKFAGGIVGITIDGAGAGAGSSGVHNRCQPDKRPLAELAHHFAVPTGFEPVSPP